jgi:hypothetical protein
MPRLLILLFAFIISVQSVSAEVMKYRRQTIYVPAYSHIYVGPKSTPFDLAVTLSIRNTNPSEGITITAADYYNTDGKMLASYVKEPVKLGAFATVRYVVAEADREGGSGANFVVKWYSDKDVNAPVVESVMIGTRSSQGISFTSRGVVIED